MSDKKYIVTSALLYANGPIHIGHLAGAYLPADIYVRYLKNKGKDVVFICGSDEHGAAITMQAKKEGLTPQEIINKFHKKNKGGFLGADYVSKGGLPVINIPGCPAHPDWITQILVAIAVGRIGDVVIDDYHRPKTFFTDFVQDGCTNVTNFAQKVDGNFGKRGGCLFYEVGCRHVDGSLERFCIY